MTSQALPRAAVPGAQRTLPARRSSVPRVRPLAVFVIAVLVAFFGMIFSRISVDRTAFELEELDGQISVELERKDRLRVETARLVDPSRITARADELGLVYPERRTPLRVSAPGAAPVSGNLDVPTLRTERP